MPKKIDPALKARAVRMVATIEVTIPRDTALRRGGGKKLGVGRETVRRWVVQADVDAGQPAGSPAMSRPRSSGSRPRTGELRRTTRSSRRRRFSSPGNSTPATADHGVHRRHESRGPRGRVDLRVLRRAGLPGRRADLPGLESRPAARSRPEQSSDAVLIATP